MPIIPTVFRPIRSNDFQRRSFKAFKNYYISSSNTETTASGYIAREAFYRTTRGTPGDTGPGPLRPGIGWSNFHIGDFSAYNPLLNSSDQSYPHLIWCSLDHRYYAHPYNPGRSAELTNRSVTYKDLYISASTLTLPYFDVGERIKAGSMTGTFINDNWQYTLQDDGHGNLRDPLILTSSMATSSRCFFHLSFNKDFKNHGPVEQEYEIITQFNSRVVPFSSQYVLKDGIVMSGIDDPIQAGTHQHSGYAFNMGSNQSKSRIRIPHNEKFNNFGKCDDWTISFWHKNSWGKNHELISKCGIRKETVFDRRNSVTKVRDNVRTMPNITASAFRNVRTPFVIGQIGKGTSTTEASGSYHFRACDGTHALHISSSFDDNKRIASTDARWVHVAVRNSASLCQIFINGDKSGTSGSIPPESTANIDDIIIGSFISGSFENGVTVSGNHIAEIRMYDYAVSDSTVESLANNHYLSGSLFQTNVAGNVFYRNGEMVVSSPMMKYNTASGAFGNNFQLSYKGTHTIYENEVLVRVPKDQMNVSMNPTATFKPTNQGTVGCKPFQRNLLPGEYRKHMFLSGTALPYITTIGLYNDDAQLLAIGKPSQAIQKRDDVDMNFIVRWDY